LRSSDRATAETLRVSLELATANWESTEAFQGRRSKAEAAEMFSTASCTIRAKSGRLSSSVRYFFAFFFAFFAFFAPFFAAFFLATVILLTEPTSDRLAAGTPG
jgi:hypothetical protein